MQAHATPTIGAAAPLKPLEWFQSQLSLSNPPLPSTVGQGTANPGEQAYEAYGLAGTQNTLSEV